MSDESAVFSQEDIDAVNAATIRRTAQLAHIAGAVLVVVGAVGVVAWAWFTIRQQLRVGGNGGFTFNSDGTPGLADRIDVVAGSFGYVMQAGLALAAGIALRLYSSVLLARNGESLTNIEVGDPFPDAPEELPTAEPR